MEQNILSTLKKYDASYDYNVALYDKLPYVRDISLCNSDTVRLESGNLVKYWKCSLKDPLPIINKHSLIDNNKDSSGDISEALWDSKYSRQNTVEKFVEMALNS